MTVFLTLFIRVCSRFCPLHRLVRRKCKPRGALLSRAALGSLRVKFIRARPQEWLRSVGPTLSIAAQLLTVFRKLFSLRCSTFWPTQVLVQLGRRLRVRPTLRAVRQQPCSRKQVIV